MLSIACPLAAISRLLLQSCRGSQILSVVHLSAPTLCLIPAFACTDAVELFERIDRYKVAVPVVEDEKIEHQEEIDVEKRIAELKDGLEKKRFKGVAIKKAKEELEKLMEKVK